MTTPNLNPNPKPKPKPNNNNTSWSMHPTLHEAVSERLSDANLTLTFHATDESDTNSHEYDTNIMGRFTCHNRACSARGWTSKKVAITIRMYPGAAYNARVYHQRCRSCHRLARPVLDASYAERVAYRLKKWCGVRGLERPVFGTGLGAGGRSEAPHSSWLCEGCRAGRCGAGSGAGAGAAAVGEGVGERGRRYVGRVDEMGGMGGGVDGPGWGGEMEGPWWL
ncbi:zinc-binding domain-domain-containing protein [Aspergillus taichungensis]|uniref:Zinc-binding domain-domain-containing protein n=1 Tax=Aspergillus taichungensis TaxID=482145 RepID=A0A2J5HQ67_9EURO|nr:zinc-binding domain-domain-containing protein [Aspergillus taichungensis]